MLINNGRHIDAVNLAFAFELTEQFPPVSLLKSYLNEASKASTPSNSGNASPTVQVCSLCLGIIWTRHFSFYHIAFQMKPVRCLLLCHGPCIKISWGVQWCM